MATNASGRKSGSSSGFVKDLENWFAKKQFNGAERAKLYNKMSSLLKNGVPMLPALEQLYARASNKGKSPSAPLALVIASLMDSVRSGGSFSAALRNWVPTAEAMLLSAGERSGTLEDAMLSAVEVMESGKRMSAAVKSSLTYPGILLGACVAIMYMFGTKVIPEFARASDPSTWTGVAAAMHSMSELVRVWTLPAVGAVVGIAIGLTATLPRYTGDLRVTLDSLPPWSMYRISVGSGFMISLAALVKSGVPLEKALMELKNTATPYLQQRIVGAIMGLRSGVNFGEALNRAGHKFPDQEMIDDISIYASLSGFDRAMEIVAKEWLEKGVADVQAKAKALNGLAMGLMAGVIGFLVYGLISIQQMIGQSVQNVG